MPTGFEIGPITIRFYGIILMLGALAAAFLAEREARRRGIESEIIWDVFVWVLIGGIIGARLWHIFTPPPSMVAQGITVQYYLTHPLDAIAIWRGGVGIPGAVIGGVLALYWYTRRKRLNFPTLLDVGAPALALGQAIGRWGNYVNQELYGAPTDLPWAIYIDEQHRLPEFMDQAYYHPVFFYEFVWNLLNMGFLLWAGRRLKDRLLPGDLFLFYLIIYPVGRFFLEFLRLDSSQIAGINANQTFMAIIAVLAISLFIWRHRRQEKSSTTAVSSHTTEATESTER